MSQAYIHPIVLVPGVSTSMDKVFYQWTNVDKEISKIKDQVELKSIESVYVPLYIVDVYAHSRYKGEAVVTLTRVVTVKTKQGYTTRTETRHTIVYVSGEYDKDFRVPVIARRAPARKTLVPLIQYYLDSIKNAPSPIPLENVEWDNVKGQVLSPEILPNEAELYARDLSCEELHSLVEDRMTTEAMQMAAVQHPGWTPSFVSWEYKIIPCRSEVIRMSPIILLPMIHAVYSFQQRIYQALFAGWDGRKVYSEEPVSSTSRKLSFLGAILSSGILGGAGFALFQHGGDGSLLGVILLMLGMAGSYYLTKEAIKDVNIETLE